MIEITNKQIIESYYSNSLSELQSGCTIEDMQEVLYYYEELENYLACEGVKRAIDDFKYILFFNVINKNTLS